MKTLKKSFSVFLALIMMLSVCGVCLSASAKQLTLIERVDVTLDTDIAGKSYYDYKDIFTIETEHVDYDYSRDSSLYFLVGEHNYYDKPLKPAETYEFDFYFVAEDGYYFDSDTVIYINGELVSNEENSGTYLGDDELFVLWLDIDQTIDGDPIVYEPIKRVDITLDTDIAGKTYLDYKDIYTIETDHIDYDDSMEGWSGIYFYDDGDYYDGALKAGKMYTFDFNITAEDGYCFDENTKIYINGALVEPDYFQPYFDYESDLHTLKFGTKQIIDGSFLAKLITAISQFFAKISAFFNNIFNSPIVPLNF